jgi:hypothetical protein
MKASGWQSWATQTLNVCASLRGDEGLVVLGGEEDVSDQVGKGAGHLRLPLPGSGRPDLSCRPVARAVGDYLPPLRSYEIDGVSLFLI